MINLFAATVVIVVAYGIGEICEAVRSPLPLIVFVLVALLAYRILTMRGV